RGREVGLPLDPRLDLGVLEVLHVAVGVFDLLAPVLVGDGAHRRDRRGFRRERWVGGAAARHEQQGGGPRRQTMANHSRPPATWPFKALAMVGGIAFLQRLASY